MDVLLFNFNDLALLLVIGGCLMLSILLLATSRGTPRAVSNKFLAIFLLAVGLEAFDTLIYWSEAIKTHYFAHSIAIFFLLKFAPFVQGPCLFWYTRSVIYADFSLRRADGLHLIFLLLFVPYIYLIWVNLGPERLARGVYDYEVYFANGLYRGLLLAQLAVIIGYAIASFRTLAVYRENLKANYSNLESIDKRWLRLLIGGFLFIWLWNLLAQVAHLVSYITVADVMGVLGNYLDFILVNTLVFYSLLYADIARGKLSQEPVPGADAADTPSDGQVLRLTKAMEEDAIYLEPELSLEQLAAHLGLPARQVSNIINRTFDKNFFEFVNFYRVEKAKALLANAEGRVTILDLMEKSGFNSKSAFNRFFKKYTGMTPTQYKSAGGQREG